jgi:hypothetical protein
MPVPALAALVMLAIPAQTGMHVIDVVESSEGFACRARDLPDLRIAHDWRDGDRGASWTFRGREEGLNALRMSVTFRPALERPRGAEAMVLGFQLDLAKPLVAVPAAAHLRIDGRPDAMILVLDDPTPRSVSVALLDRLRGPLADRLMSASVVALDLTDASGAPLGRYSWDVRALRRAPELLQLINWSCR